MGLFGRQDTDDEVATDDGAERPAPAAFEMGAPGRCPACNGFGYIDHIDMVNRIQVQHCRECRHRWEFSFDEDGAVIDLRDEVVDTTPSRLDQRVRR